MCFTGVRRTGYSKSEAVKKFVFIEDSETTRMLWSMKWSFGELLTFKTPEEFFARVENNCEFINSVSCVISDFHFGELSKRDGKYVAQKLRDMGLKMPIIIASDGRYAEEDFDGLVDAVFTKNIPSQEILENVLAKVKKTRL